MTTAIEQFIREAGVPDDWSASVDARGNFSGWGLRCKHCGYKLNGATRTATGWDAEHVAWVSELREYDWCDNPEPLPAANVGKNTLGTWSLMDPWGTLWAFGFKTRKQATRFAYALVLRQRAVWEIEAQARDAVL